MLRNPEHYTPRRLTGCERKRLASNCYNARVLLYSPLGTGKTSLIQAALVPALRERDLLVRRPIRVNLDPGLMLADTT